MIVVNHLTKQYGTTMAVKDVTFRIGRDEIVGFLGPNGAGKSTLLKMLSTWLPPTAGTIEVAGHDVNRQPLAIRRLLGYLPEHNALYEDMRVDRLLRFVGRIRGLRGEVLTQRMEWVVMRCDLGAVLGKRVHQCSKGYRQRVGVALALIHDPPIIVLDEPTHGLDPLQVVAFRDLIRSLRAGRTIIFSSHILSEVTSICERLLIINDGALLADTPLAVLESRAQEKQQDLERTVLDIVKPAGSGR